MAIMKYPSPTPKYPGVGDNYMKRVREHGTGEWQGFVYDPYIDKYRPDPKQQQQYYEESGLVDKQEKPNLFEQLYPGVASVATYEIGKAAGPEIYAAGKGLLGLGEASTGAATGSTAGAGAGAGTAGEVAAIDAGATTAGAEAGSGAATGSSLSSLAIPAAALLSAAYIGNRAYEGYKAGEGKSTGEAAKETGTGKEANATWLVGGPYGYMARVAGGLAGSLFGSKKDEDQKKRDAVRKAFQEAGFVDQDFNLNLAGGKKFNIGADGSQSLYNVDLSTPEAERDLKLVAPLAKILTGGDEKLGSDFAGYFTNAIRSEGDVLANAKEMYKSAGINSWDQARAALQQLKTAGKLSDQEVAVYDQGLANIFGNKGLEAPLAQLSTAPAIIPVQTPEASPMSGLLALKKPASDLPESAAVPIARTPAPAASPFSGLMALGRPTNPEDQTMVVPVARGGYR